MSMLIEPIGTSPRGSLGPQELAPLLKFQKTLTLATGLSLAVAAPDGRCLACCSHPSDRLHSRLVDRPGWLAGLLRSGPAGGIGFRLQEGLEGLSFALHPVHAGPELLGFVVAGPVLGPGAEADALAGLMEMTRQEVEDALAGHPARTPLEVERARDLTASLAELTAQLILDRRQQRRSLDTLAGLYEVGRALGASLELDEVLETVLSRSVSLLQASAGSLTFLDEARSELRILLCEGGESAMSVTRAGLSEEAEAWVSGEGEVGSLPSSALSIPLKVHDRCLGVVKLGDRLDGSLYGDHDLHVLSILAGHAASAVYNAQLYSRVRRQVRELEALHGVAQAVNSSLHLQETLQQVLDNACELLGARAASVMLLEADGQHLAIRLSRGLPDEVVRTTRVRLGERISGRVARDGHVVNLPRGRTSSGEWMEAALCVPLMVDNKVVGVLNVRAREDFEEFSQEDVQLAVRLASISAAALENAELHDELEHLLVESITALANAIDARDEYTRGHSERVTEYTVMLATHLGLEEDEIERIRYAALLHDIGKIRIPDPILNKPGRLTDEEFHEMKRHPSYGAEIMRPVRAFRPLLPYMVHHHERYDGRGYPDGIAGEDIPLAARMICVADCFDAMTTDRPYRRGMTLEVALEELRKNRGGQFDPRVVDAFLQLVQEGKVQTVLEKMRSHTGPSAPSRGGRAGGGLVGRRSPARA